MISYVYIYIYKETTRIETSTEHVRVNFRTIYSKYKSKSSIEYGNNRYYQEKQAISTLSNRIESDFQL